MLYWCQKARERKQKLKNKRAEPKHQTEGPVPEGREPEDKAHNNQKAEADKRVGG